jgi:hypothetical protein
VEILNFSLRHITAKIISSGSNSPWLFTGFYGHPDRSKREESWHLLSHLSTLYSLDWLCVGDFNEIADPSEKVGGNTQNEVQMAKFCSTLTTCNLGDLGFRGPKYKWSNKQNTSDFIKARLDRALANVG